MQRIPIPVEGGLLGKGGRLTMAGTKVWKPGLSPDRRMKHAAVKSERELIADPKGTAVNTALLVQSPQADRAARPDG